jgi:hypothetical protein
LRGRLIIFQRNSAIFSDKMTPIFTEVSPPGAAAAIQAGTASADSLPAFLQSQVFPVAINLLGALAILLAGWLLAGLVAGTSRRLLRRTRLDQLMASGPHEAIGGFSLERLIATVIFWVILVLALVAALNVLNLATVSEPLNQFLNQIFAFLPKLGAAAVLAAVGWLLASLGRTAVRRSNQLLNFEERFIQEETGGRSLLVSETLANLVYWLVLLFFLPLVLNALGLDSQLAPVANLLNDLLAALPRLIKAAAIAAVGWFIARSVSRIVCQLVSSAGGDQLGESFGLRSENGQGLAWLVGTITYVLLLIPTATAALEALAIAAISEPATAMLNRVLGTLPQIFTAVLIVAAAVAIGRFVGQLVTQILQGFGFDRVFTWLGIETSGENADSTPRAPGRQPSELVGVVVMVGILLFSLVAATDVLGLPALTRVVTGLLSLSGQVMAGLVVFAIGLYLANLAAGLLRSSGSQQGALLAQISRVSILAFSGAMALQQIGVAPGIVNLAFGLLLGAIAVAAALAVGLGGRDVAAEQWRAWMDDFRKRP